jgi:hypothetical protein
MIVAALLTLAFMALVDVRSMVWPLLGYAFVTTWALLTIGIRFTMGQPEASDVY